MVKGFLKGFFAGLTILIFTFSLAFIDVTARNVMGFSEKGGFSVGTYNNMVKITFLGKNYTAKIPYSLIKFGESIGSRYNECKETTEIVFEIIEYFDFVDENSG